MNPTPSQPTHQGDAATQSPGVPPNRPRFPFAILFCVWLLVVITTTLVTMVLPESFGSTARIRIERDSTDIHGLAEGGAPAGYDPHFLQSEFEMIQSERVLQKVIELLDLNREWGRRFANNERLKTFETLGLLKGRIDLRPIRNTSLIEIRVYSERADEAAKIANAIAEAYRQHRLEQRTARISAGIRALEEAYVANRQQLRRLRSEVAELSREQSNPASERLADASQRIEELQAFGRVLSSRIANEKTDLGLPASGIVQIVDTAFPGTRPVRPNKPLNIFIGIVLGGGGGLFLATLVYVLQRREFRRRSGVSRVPFPPRFRAGVHIFIALLIGLIVGYHCASPMELTTLIVIPLSLLLGGIASAYIELANLSRLPTPLTTSLEEEPKAPA
jgi:uncharacterized protein involved in exopolysaccharide biosynthesis